MTETQGTRRPASGLPGATNGRGDVEADPGTAATPTEGAAGNCVFCRIIAGTEPATIVSQWHDAIAIIPIGPIVGGHTLVIPRRHVTDYVEDPAVTAVTMQRAAELTHQLGLKPANLITSAGKAATQSVFHLHVHIVPRAENDGLALPWYSGRTKGPRRG